MLRPHHHHQQHHHHPLPRTTHDHQHQIAQTTRPTRPTTMTTTTLTIFFRGLGHGPLVNSHLCERQSCFQETYRIRAEFWRRLDWRLDHRGLATDWTNVVHVERFIKSNETHKGHAQHQTLRHWRVWRDSTPRKQAQISGDCQGGATNGHRVVQRRVVFIERLFLPNSVKIC